MRRLRRHGMVGPVLGLCLALGFGPVGAEPGHPPDHIRFQRLSVEQGLSQVTGNCFAQDQTGFLWVGTQNGLNRYDGYEFRVYPTSGPDIRGDDWVDALLVDGAGGMWIGTRSGGLLYRGPRSVDLTAPLNLPESGPPSGAERITALMEDGHGGVWVGSAGGGLFQLSDPNRPPRRFRHDRLDPATLSSDKITALLLGRDGALWVGTDRGLDRVDPGTGRVERLLTRQQPPVGVLAVWEDRGGVVWLGGADGLWAYRPETRRLERTDWADAGQGSGAGVAVSVLREDRAGRLWVGTRGHGLVVIDAGRQGSAVLRPARHDPQALVDGHVAALFEDRGGSMWVGTYSGGIHSFHPLRVKFSHTTERPGQPGGLPDSRVRSLYADGDGTMWVGTDGGGLAALRADGRLLRHYRHQPGDPRSLSHDMVRVVLRDRSERLWVGTDGGGLNRLDVRGEGFERFRHDPADPGSLGSDHVFGLCQDHTGTLWVGTEGGGLHALDPQTGRVTARHTAQPGRPHGLSSNHLRKIVEDGEHNLWVASIGGGLSRLDPSRQWFEVFRHDSDRPDSLSGNRVSALCLDPSGRVWAGTWGRGLNLYLGGGAFRRFGPAEGLPSEVISGILADDEGHIWLASLNGLTRLHPESGQVRTFDTHDGLQGDAFNSGAYLRGPDGRMHFGGPNGFSSFDPAEGMPLNPNLPPVAITAIRVFDRPLPPDVPLDNSVPIVLSYRENFISFEFAALDYVSPGRNRYMYHLEGVDPDWIVSGSRRYASYTDLPGGEYTFRVRGSNGDGLWSETGATLRLRVVPPVWRTAGFQWSLAFLAAGAVFGAFYLRVRHIQKLNRRLEQRVEARTADLRLKTDELEGIARVVQAVNAQLSLDGLLAELLELTRSLLGARAAGIWLSGSRPGWFHLARRIGDPAPSPPPVPHRRSELHGALAGGVEAICPDIHLVPPGGGDPPAGPGARLVLRILAGLSSEGFLVLDLPPLPDPEVRSRVEVLGQLKGHLAMALMKVRLLEELESRAERISQQNEELRALNDTRNEFLGMAAHDLRSPLNAMFGYFDLMIAEIESGSFQPAEWLPELVALRHTVGNVTTMINDLLDLSAIEAGRLRIERKPGRLGEVLTEAERLYRRVALQKGIRLRVEMEGQLPEVNMDRVRILEVLTNLLGNALKFTPPGGAVILGCRVEGEEVLTTVTDTGPGLTAGEVERLFQPYARVSTRPTAGEPSTGLGLAIVKKIIDLHEGRVWAEPTPGRGGRFHFALRVASGCGGGLPVNTAAVG